MKTLRLVFYFGYSTTCTSLHWWRFPFIYRIYWKDLIHKCENVQSRTPWLHVPYIKCNSSMLYHVFHAYGRYGSQLLHTNSTRNFWNTSSFSLECPILQYTGVATVWYMMFSIHLPGSQLLHTCTNSDQKFFEPLLASPLCFLFCKYAQDKSLYGMYLWGNLMYSFHSRCLRGLGKSGKRKGVRREREWLQ